MTGALGIINIVLATLFGPVNAVFGGDPDWGLVLFGLISGIWIWEKQND